MADLQGWMGAATPMSIRVLTAEAGVGKTRLALQLCDEASRQGWDAGFVSDTELERFRREQNASTWGWRRPTLVVVDYAAARVQSLAPWLAELADRVDEEDRPLRLLLLERQADPAGGWWREAFGYGGRSAEAVRRLLDPASGPVILSPLVAQEDRRGVLNLLLERLGSPLRAPEANINPDFDRRLAEISWAGSPLFLLMAGLIAARSGFPAALALSGTDLGFQIARHEIGRLEQLAAANAHSPLEKDALKRFLPHLAACVTLRQGVQGAEAIETLIEGEKQALRYGSAGDPPVLRAVLATALSAGQADSLPPILPDLIGEAVLLEALGGGSQDKAEASVSRAIAEAGDRCTGVLIRLAQDYGAARPEPLRWFARVVDGATTLDSLGPLLAQLPESTLTLREPAEVLARKAVEITREQGKREQLVVYLNNLSIRLSDLGRREEALAAIGEAVGQYRELAAARPDAFRPDLAISLHNLSAQLSDLGRREEALAAIEEAVEIRRELAATHPDAFRPNLASSLNNLSVQLSDLGRSEEALEAIEEAVGQYRELADTRPGAFRPDLARSLNTLSVQLSRLGRSEEALEDIEEAVGQYRELAAVRPDAFRPDLAASLNTLSNRLSSLGRREEALEAIEEAVGRYRELAAVRPDAFRPDLAVSLHTLSNRLSNLGRTQEALTAIEEAVGIRRELAAARPNAFRPNLASSLNNLSSHLSDMGRKEEALAAIEEAVRCLGPHFLLYPAAFRPWMGLFASNYLRFASALGREADPTLLAPIQKRLAEE